MRKLVISALCLAGSSYAALTSAVGQTQPSAADACVGEIKAALVRMRDAGPQKHVEDMTATGRTVRRTSIFVMPHSVSVELSQTTGTGSATATSKTHVIVIGSKVWRLVGGDWTVVGDDDAAQVVEGVQTAHRAMAEIEAAEARCDGADTVDGAPVKVYSFSNLFMFAHASGVTVTKIYVGADGRPVRMESSTKLSDSVTVRRTVITYDPSIRIEPPLR